MHLQTRHLFTVAIGQIFQTGREVMQLFIETTALSSQWYEKRLSPRMSKDFIQKEPTPIFSCRRQYNHFTTQS